MPFSFSNFVYYFLSTLICEELSIIDHQYSFSFDTLSSMLLSLDQISESRKKVLIIPLSWLKSNWLEGPSLIKLLSLMYESLASLSLRSSYHMICSFVISSVPVSSSSSSLILSNWSFSLSITVEAITPHASSILNFISFLYLISSFSSCAK